MLRVGILGAGKIAVAMSRTLHRMEERDGSACAAAVASRSADKAETFARKEEIPKAYGSYEAMLADPEIDLIYIATPHAMHEAQALMCVEAGKPVLCEKAFTGNARQAEHVLSRAEQSGVLVTEAIWTRYMPARGMIRRLLDSGAIGEVRLVTANLGYDLRTVERILRPELAGGALLDVGVYALNFAAMILGDKITRTESSAALFPTGTDAADSITLWHESGAMAQLMATALCVTDRRGIVYGTEGRLEVDNINNPARISVWAPFAEQPREVLPVPAQLTGYEYEVEACIRALADGSLECPEMPHAETLRIMRQMDALRSAWGVAYPFD